MIVALALTPLLLAAAEPVKWTPMADPDPGFVAPKGARPKRSTTKATAAARRESDPSDLDGAVSNLMEVARRHDEAVLRDFERQFQEAEATIERARQIEEQAAAKAESPPQR